MINLNRIKQTMRKIMAVDKLLHFSFSALIVLSFGLTLGIIPGILIGIIAGLAKEAYDQYIKKSIWDQKDIYADGAGILLAILLLL